MKLERKLKQDTCKKVRLKVKISSTDCTEKGGEVKGQKHGIGADDYS